MGECDRYPYLRQRRNKADQQHSTKGEGVAMKILNLTALLAGGTIALLPLDSLVEQFVGVGIALIALNAADYFIKGVQK